MPKYKMGTYYPTKKLKKYIRKNKHNKYYSGKLTKRQQDLNANRAIATIIISYLFIAIYSFVMTSNTFTIKGGGVVSKVEASKQAPLQAVEELHPPVSLTVEVLVEQQIRNIAKEHNFKWTDYLIRLARCENSALDPKVINDKGNYPIYSKDRGIFQINDYWHKEVSDECAHSIRCSTIWTMERINAGYQHEWICNDKIRNIKKSKLKRR